MGITQLGVNYRYQEIMGTLGDTAFYNFEKNTGCPEPWLPGPVCWVRMAKGNNGVYFHVHACAASVSKEISHACISVGKPRIGKGSALGAFRKASSGRSLNRWIRLHTLSRKKTCAACARVRGLHRINGLPSHWLPREESEKWAKEGVLSPQEGILGRFFKAGQYDVRPLCVKACASCARNLGNRRIREIGKWRGI